MDKPIFIKSENFFILGYPVNPPNCFTFKINEETEEKYPFCCSYHKGIYDQLKQWFEIFPNCCDGHKALVGKWSFRKDNYIHVVEKVMDNLAYTAFLIRNKINNENWFEDISDYIDYCKDSFGQPAIGIDKYSAKLKEFLVRSFSEIEDHKREKLIDFIYGRGETKAEKIEFDVLFAVYEAWLKAFPFELTTYFGGVKNHFENTLPFLSAKPVVNRYSGMAKAQLHTKDSLIGALIDITNTLLITFNGTMLNRKGLISNAGMLKMEVAENKRKQKLLQGYFGKSNKEMLPFHIAINDWFSDEMEYLSVLSEQIKQNEKEKEVRKSELMRASLEKYSFSDLPKVKILSSQSIEKLIEWVCSNGMPYAVAMFDYLGLIKLLRSEYFNSQSQVEKELSKWFESDKDGRNVKGNINTLNLKSKEDKSKFTAHLHKETVQKDYEKLK